VGSVQGDQQYILGADKSAEWSNKDMDQSEMMSNQEKNAVAGETMDSLGEPQETIDAAESGALGKDSKDELPLAAKERLGRQEKRHQKELRAMQAQIQELHSRFGSQTMPDQNQPANTYNSQPVAGEGIESHIHRAVQAALQAKDQQEAQARQAEQQAHVHKQYQALDDHLDNMSDKYEDFNDVVKAPDAPYTEAMKSAALLLPNAGDVLYKLGKNPEELKRVAKLHPLDQAKEMVKLSVALQGGSSQGTSVPRQLGSVKSNPVTPQGSVNENTSVGELRRKLKAGWK